ncbi:glycosyltransferase family 25 protein [Micrococcus luteus]|uniref:glycosyltransferase family 25 protein n=1 Tax=Micrococcus luteus TaxID=1270 RepID=UPI0014090B88|nr:glycosyltransferase family 25 protein [Micrococcus luteus]
MAVKPRSPRSRIIRRVVIALPDSTRLSGFRAQPGGEDFEVFDAIDNRSGSVTERFDVERFRDFFQRDPRPGEIGCTLSHMGVMRSFAEEVGADHDLLLVAEDDARLVEGFESIVGRLTHHVPVTSLVVLADPYGPAGRRDRSFGSKSEHFVQVSLFARRFRCPAQGGVVTMGRWSAGLTGMGLYLVTRSAARVIVRSLEDRYRGRPWWMADYHGFYRDDLGIDVLAVRPNLADWEGDSSIQDDEHVGWRAANDAEIPPVGVADFLREWRHRALRKARSTKFDLHWRLRMSQQR